MSCSQHGKKQSARSTCNFTRQSLNRKFGDLWSRKPGIKAATTWMCMFFRASCCTSCQMLNNAWQKEKCMWKYHHPNQWHLQQGYILWFWLYFSCCDILLLMKLLFFPNYTSSGGCLTRHNNLHHNIHDKLNTRSFLPQSIHSTSKAELTDAIFNNPWLQV